MSDEKHSDKKESVDKESDNIENGKKDSDD